MPLIEVNNLSKTYSNEGVDTPALRGVSFSVEKGDFIAIMGPSGSGKSTLLNVLGFLDKPTGGIYMFDGKDAGQYLSNEAAHVRNKKMGFVFQSFNLLPRTNVFDNVILPLLYSGVKEKERRMAVENAISAVGLSHRVSHESSQLSGGEKQRVAIARALVNNPEVIFADEPTGNLDSKSGKTVMEIIQKLNEAEGRTVILITHETYTAEHASRIIKLHDGVIESDEKVKHKHHADKGFLK